MAPDSVDEVLRAVFLALARFFVLVDLAIASLWVAGYVRGQPLLARRWSVADLLLALQGVIAVVVVVGVLGVLAMFTLVRKPMASLSDAPAGLQFFLLLLPGMLAQQEALVCIPLALVWFKYRGSVRDLGLRPAPGGFGKSVLLGVALALLLLPVSDLLETLIRKLVLEPGKLPYAGLLQEVSKKADALSMLNELKSNPAAIACMVALVGLVGPVAEEVFFRGFAYRVLRERLGTTAGLLLSALLFALVHMNPVGLVPIFVMGLVLAWLYQRTGSLAASIGLHCANNLLALFFYFFAPNFSLWDRFFSP
jgi:membrane protease YdiL (CAAX protease family)